MADTEHVSVKVKRLLESLNEEEIEELDILLLERTHTRIMDRMANRREEAASIVLEYPMLSEEMNLAAISISKAILAVRKRTGLSLADSRTVVREQRKRQKGSS